MGASPKGSKEGGILSATPIEVFGPDDFVFLDKMFNPFFVHNMSPEGEPEAWWMHYWHENQRSWVSLRKITEQEREECRKRSLSRLVAEIYFKRTEQQSMTEKHFQIWYREFGIDLGIGEKNCRDIFNGARAKLAELLP
jgi:hypothetical protein